MSTIRIVSKLAGVSTATVSRALKNPQLVSPDTRQRVMQAVQTAGYRPNQLARNFSSGKAYAMVVLVPNVANPFFSRVIRGIEQEAQACGYAVLLGDTQGSVSREQEYARMGLTSQADGLIQLDSRYPFSDEDRELASTVPFVNACERIAEPAGYPVVELDNRGAARALTQHLLDLNLTRLAVITGPANSPIVRARLAGMQDALLAAGLMLNPAALAEGNFSMQSGHDAALQLLQQSERPQAIFCMNDEMAIGAMRCLRQQGLRIPQDIAIAGFDNIEYAAFTEPGLTTIDQPAEQLGRQAMRALYQLMQGKPLAQQHIVLPYQLVVRDSTAAITDKK
ncbi:LacI family DNA-binding transcriptional regulator [Chromatiaceae bacterium AAb-1]|nr:LacI family DNA-binding transcriptional regulator [Chromatiaceae bacterium AAb-1]